ncbi:MAG: hypothetical protein HW412_701, partial [Bacteroidetes bacterium]|nr:hypothetical protein [Bacteroidota bacterium]
TLDVSINGGDIRIVTWEKNEVSVSIESFDEEEEYNDVRMSQQGNTVRITDRDSWGSDARFDITVPSQFNLRLETSNGDISVKGNLVGNIDGETSAGNIKLGDVEGTVEMRTSGGDIRAGKINGRASLGTSGGEIDVVSSTSELDLRSSGGDIRVGNVGKSLRAKTAGGDIIIGDVGGEATVATAGGNVRVGKVSGQASLSTAGGDVELNGGNGTIRASTSGGNILLANLSGSVDAKTSGGDIHAELTPTGKGKSRLSSSNGIIKLYIPETAKATITARIRIQGWWRSQKDEYLIRSDFKEESSLRDEDEREIEAKYVLNGGGESITLETVNSDIEIRKLKK